MRGSEEVSREERRSEGKMERRRQKEEGGKGKREGEGKEGEEYVCQVASSSENPCQRKR